MSNHSLLQRRSWYFCPPRVFCASLIVRNFRASHPPGRHERWYAFYRQVHSFRHLSPFVSFPDGSCAERSTLCYVNGDQREFCQFQRGGRGVCVCVGFSGCRDQRGKGQEVKVRIYSAASLLVCKIFVLLASSILPGSDCVVAF